MSRLQFTMPVAPWLADTLSGEAPGHVDEARALIEWYSRR
jgi:hypothetical protein